MKRIKIVCIENNSVYFIKRVLGYRVEIKGFEKYKFYVHENVNLATVKEDGLYLITDAHTGANICSGGNTVEEAVNIATKRLNKEGKRKFLEVRINPRKIFLDLMKNGTICY